LLPDTPVDYNEDLCVMDADGSDVVKVISTPTLENWPSWGPAQGGTEQADDDDEESGGEDRGDKHHKHHGQKHHGHKGHRGKRHRG
jgi:hypothetical protein